MPVEIKELIIRAVVAKDGESQGISSPSQAPLDDPDAIIAACVKQVLKILKQSQER